jgi:phosphatidylserine/phosphatidylglycerophosphate/cardiolipin synthase-like enzyme
VELIVQPEDGVAPLIKAIDTARKSIEIAIFRFDRKDLQHALERAVARGVVVHALIASTNHGGEKDLRSLESDFLRAGIAVGRTDSDLLRYHYKFMIIDREILYVLTFNYTHLDIAARSFGIVTRNPGLVHEAIKLFGADLKRQSYTPEVEHFVVSPLNARQQLSDFIEGAREQLLIYDPEISDRRMIHLLRRRAEAGVEIRIVGTVKKSPSPLGANGLLRMRFHTRTIIRDREWAFVGSQSLREAELDNRRELGLIIHNADTVHSLVKIFESDWATLRPRSKEHPEKKTPGKQARKRARAIVRELPLRPLVEKALKRALNDIPCPDRNCEDTMEETFRQALEDSVSHMVMESTKAEARR